MNVVYSSSNEYTRHLGISITSLFEKNKHVKNLTVYLIEYGIQEDNIAKLDSIATAYGRNIVYIPFFAHEHLICTDSSYNIPKNSYARLLLAELLPPDIDRIIWLDCDTVVTDSLSDLWDTDLKGRSIAAVQDCGSGYFWPETCQPSFFRYFCGGVFVADLSKWRQHGYTQKFLDFIQFKNGHLEHVDQTVLNGVLYNDFVLVHPRYDVLTPTFVMSYSNLINYFKLEQGYYSKQEIHESIKNPAIIHFTSSNTGRPWETGNKHPKAQIYQRYWFNSPWKDEPWGQFTPHTDKIFRRTYWLYQHVPFSLIHAASSLKKYFSRTR